jgi:two-component system, NarL family, sensor kinase
MTNDLMHLSLLHFIFLLLCANTATAQPAMQVLETLRGLNDANETQAAAYLSQLKAQSSRTDSFLYCLASIAQANITRGGGYQSAHLQTLENTAKTTANDTLKYLAWREIGYSKIYLSEFDAAFPYFKRTYEIAQRWQNPLYKAENFQDFAVINYYQNRPEIALEYLEKALQLVENKAEFVKLASRLYHIKGSIYTDAKAYEKGKTFLKKAIALRENAGINDRQMLLSYRVLTTLYIETQAYAEAKTQCERIIATTRKNNNKIILSDALMHYSDLLYRMNDDANAIQYSEEALAIHHAQLNDPFARANVFRALAKQYERIGDLKTAIRYKDSVEEVQRIINIKERTKQALQFESQFRNDLLKKENAVQELEIINQRNQKILIGGGLGLLLLLGGAAVWFWQYRKQKQIKAFLAEQALLQERNKMKLLVEGEERERKRIASELHDGLGALLSAARMNISILEEDAPSPLDVFAKQTSALIRQAVNEVRTISHNLMPENLVRNGLQPALTDLVQHINTTQKVHINLVLEGLAQRMNAPQHEIAIFRIVQELLNNTLRHAKAKTIDLTLSQTKNGLKIILHDDGIGFDTHKINDADGIGWRNVFTRVQLLNGTINVVSEVSKGTETVVIMNYEL